MGGTDTQTAEYFARKFNCQISTVLNLPLDGLFIFERGCAPRKAGKYDLSSDTAYRSLMMPKNPEAAKTGAAYGKEAL